MRVTLLGFGAAGNKASICAVKNNIVSMENTVLINSTLKDIPKDYKGETIEFSNAYGGCGKERKISYDLCMASLQDGTINLDKILKINDPDNKTELAIIVASTEGGTGSGAVPVVAKYIHDVLGINVHVFGFTGFEEDVRGLKNTVEFFQELETEFTVECICNSKFLSECNGNRIKAELEANKAFAEKISILIGHPLRDSDHNIDATDLLKISTTQGFMIIETAIIKDKIKNRDQFKKFLIDMIDNSKSLDLDNPSQRKIAVMLNINENSTDYIDYTDILYERYGTCFEKFEHIQHEDDQPEFLAFISAGSKMPVKEVEDIYNKYRLMTNRVNKTNDDFFSVMKNKPFEDNESMFDLGSHSKPKSTLDKNAFFNKQTKEKETKKIEDMY